MTYVRCTWLADVLWDAGLEVVTHDGWKTRGLPGQSFEPRGVVIHHDASKPGPSPGVPAYMLGRFATGAAQLWVSTDGVWHVLAAGRAPHAGVVKPGALSNYTALGIETDHTVGEAWPPSQLRSLRVGVAAILVRLEVPARTGLTFHRTVAFPPGRKIDPAGLRLKRERRIVQAIMAPPAPPDHVVVDRVPDSERPGRHRPHVPYRRRLRFGMRGTDVADLKRHLGLPGRVYGPRTLRRVTAAQRAARGRLGVADGVVGPLTYAAVCGHR